MAHLHFIDEQVEAIRWEQLQQAPQQRSNVKVLQLAHGLGMRVVHALAVVAAAAATSLPTSVKAIAWLTSSTRSSPRWTLPTNADSPASDAGATVSELAHYQPGERLRYP